MAKYERFEDLPVWQEATRLYNRVMDLLEMQGLPLTAGFRNQLDRAALSVSNNVAEGFERATTNELLSFIAIAKGSAAEVRSMMAVVRRRPKLQKFTRHLDEIRELAESCARQLRGWGISVDGSPVRGKRHLNGSDGEMKRAAKAAKDFREKFLKNLKAEHPLYHSEEARRARGERVE